MTQSGGCPGLSARLAGATDHIARLEPPPSETGAPKAGHPLMAKIASRIQGAAPRLSAIDAVQKTATRVNRCSSPSHIQRACPSNTPSSRPSRRCTTADADMRGS